MNPIERTARRIDELQQRSRPLAFTFGISKKFGDDNAGTLVTNLAFSAFLSIFPLLLILVTVLGIVLAGNASFRHDILNSTFARFPVVGRQLSANIHSLHKSSVFGLVIGLLLLLWGTVGFSQAGLFAMEQIWNPPGPERPNYPKRFLRSLGFLAILGSGLIVSGFLAAFGTFGQHNLWLGIVGEALAIVVNVAQYLLAFRVLTPKVVATKDLVPGAVVGAIAWTGLLALGGYLIGHDLKNDTAIYGTFGIVLGLMAWLYLGAEISIYAAELNTVLARRLWPRAMVQPPLTEADQRSMALQATQNQRRPEQRVSVTFSEPPQTEDEVRALRQEEERDLQEVSRDEAGDFESTGDRIDRVDSEGSDQPSKAAGGDAGAAAATRGRDQSD